MPGIAGRPGLPRGVAPSLQRDGAGVLDAASCQLGDRTPYAPYRIDLPVRGQIQLQVSGTPGDFFSHAARRSGIRLDSGAVLARPIEAGSYTLLVNGAAPGQTGSFTVNASFTAEPGILCSTFPNIGRDQTVSGKLPGSGCVASRRHALRSLYSRHGTWMAR